MKKTINLLSAFILILFFSSCTKDDISKDLDVLGVWQTSSENTDYTLVFGENQTGLSIVANMSGNELTSTAVPFTWEASENEIAVLDELDLSSIYVANTEGELVLNAQQNALYFKKTSKDYSKYY